MDWFKTPFLILILSGPTCSPIDFQAGPLPPIPDGGSDDSTDSQTDTIEDSGTDSDTDTDTDVDTDTDSDTGPDASVDTDSDSDTDTDTDSDSDTDTDSDTEAPDLCSGPGVWLDEGWTDAFVSWPGTRCWQDPPAPDVMTWSAAVTYCGELELAGHDDWRMPTVTELRYLGRPNSYECGDCGLVDPGSLTEFDIEGCEPCMPLLGGDGAGGCYWPPELAESGCDVPVYWSSSELWGDPDDFAWLWGYHGNYPGTSAYNKASSASVRCVRPL